jgi:hypothetical protein
VSRRPDKASARRRLAARVATELKDSGIDVVLVGGSVVSLYSAERHVTDDLDFVSYQPLRAIARAMTGLGWKMIGNRAVRSETDFYVQFCAPPLAVGREPVQPVPLRVGRSTLHLLSATDCVLDRLMKFYHWGDLQGLEQAVLVARHQPIDLERVAAASLREGKRAEHETFRRRLRES